MPTSGFYAGGNYVDDSVVHKLSNICTDEAHQHVLLIGLFLQDLCAHATWPPGKVTRRARDASSDYE